MEPFAFSRSSSLISTKYTVWPVWAATCRREWKRGKEGGEVKEWKRGGRKEGGKVEGLDSNTVHNTNHSTCLVSKQKRKKQSRYLERAHETATKHFNI